VPSRAGGRQPRLQPMDYPIWNDFAALAITAAFVVFLIV
jgi:hypothetical protein